MRQAVAMRRAVAKRQAVANLITSDGNDKHSKQNRFNDQYDGMHPTKTSNSNLTLKTTNDDSHLDTDSASLL